MRSGPKPKPLAARFWARINKNGPIIRLKLGKCWVWNRPFSRYPMLATPDTDTAAKTAANVAWYLETGEWPKNFTCHKCDNKACARFSHLFDGTAQENTLDAVAKGLHVGARPREAHWNAKLSETEVSRIRRDARTYREISQDYKISQSQIGRIKNGKRWK